MKALYPVSCGTVVMKLEDLSYITIFSTKTMVKLEENFESDNQVCCMKQCVKYVWVSLQPLASVESGVVDIYNQTTKDLVHNIKVKADIYYIFYHQF